MSRMSKYLSVVALVALGALGVLGLSAQAAVANDPQDDCLGQTDGMHYQWIQTEPDTAFANSEMWGGAVLCGTDNATYKGFPSGKIESPEMTTVGSDTYGMEYRCANPDHPNICSNSDGSSDLSTGSYISSSSIDMSLFNDQHQYGLGLNDLHVDFYTNRAPGGPVNAACQNETYEGNPVVQCTQGKTRILGLDTYSSMIVTKYQQGTGVGSYTGRYRMYIFQPEVTMPDGTHLVGLLTKVGKRGSWSGPQHDSAPDPTDSQESLHICKYAGPVNGTACGSSVADWLTKNGRQGIYVQCGPAQQGVLTQPYGWVITANKTPGWGMASKGCGNDQWFQ